MRHELPVEHASARAVEIDDVHERRSCRGEAPYERERVACIHGDTVEVAALEPDGLAREHVDRGNHERLVFHHANMLT